MKSLYNYVYEGILDDEEDILAAGDKAADLAMGKFLEERLIGSYTSHFSFVYNEKKKHVKTDKFIKIDVKDGIICAKSHFHTSLIFTPWSEIKKFVDSFEADFEITADALRCGLKLSDINIKSKKCILKFPYDNGRGIAENLILGFFDTTPGSQWGIDTQDGYKLHNSSLASKIGCIQTSFLYCKKYDEAVNIVNNIKSANSNVMYLSCCYKWLCDIDSSWYYRSTLRNAHSIEDLFDKKKTGSGPVMQDIYERIKNLIKNNPRCKILLSLAYLSDECSHVWLEGDQLKHERIRSRWPWLKVK